MEKRANDTLTCSVELVLVDILSIALEHDIRMLWIPLHNRYTHNLVHARGRSQYFSILSSLCVDFFKARM